MTTQERLTTLCTYLQLQREIHTHTHTPQSADPTSLHIHDTNGQIDS